VALRNREERKAAHEQVILAAQEQWAAELVAYKAGVSATVQEDARREAASPISQATTAKEQGQGFFEIQLEVGSSQRDTTIFGGNNDNLGQNKTQSHAGTLAVIEAIGWRLEHVGHVFVVTSESSRNKLLLTGQQTAVSGNTIGIYLFRNTD
jgi:hypothetical protein